MVLVGPVVGSVYRSAVCILKKGIEDLEVVQKGATEMIQGPGSDRFKELNYAGLSKKKTER